MSVFLIYTFLFAVGGVSGRIIEVIFRRYVSQKHWVNPGFLTGPCLPLYGGSLCILYTLAELEGAINIEPTWLEKILLFLLMALAITLLEYAVGTIMISTIHIRLWDYSECFGNIRGIICPRFTFYWGLLSAGYYFLVHPHIMDALEWLSHNLTFSFVIGFFYGIFVIDLAYSTQIIRTIRKFAEEKQIVVRLEELREQINYSIEQHKPKFFLSLKTDRPFREVLESYRNKSK